MKLFMLTVGVSLVLTSRGPTTTNQEPSAELRILQETALAVPLPQRDERGELNSYETCSSSSAEPKVSFPVKTSDDYATVQNRIAAEMLSNGWSAGPGDPGLATPGYVSFSKQVGTDIVQASYTKDSDPVGYSFLLTYVNREFDCSTGNGG